MPQLPISVVVNNYNYARHLGACIGSVLPQLRPGDELIVVDDGSTDGSIELLRAYEDRIRLIAQANGGQAAAMNAGVATAGGEILLLLDADDIFLPDKLATIRAAFARLPRDRPLALLHRFRWIDAAGAPLTLRAAPRLPLRRRWRVMTPARAVRLTDRYGYLGWPCDARTSMVCLNRAMAERLFPLPAQEARICADEFVVRGALYSGDVHCLERALTAYRDHGANGWLHRSAKPQHRAYLAPLRAYLEVRHRAAGGGDGLDPERAVVTHLYVREGLSPLARCRAAWAASPRDLTAALHITTLALRRTPHWLAQRRRARQNSRRAATM